MHTLVNGMPARRSSGWAALCFLVLASAAASAEGPAPRAGHEGAWLPSFAITSGVFFQKQYASVDSFDLTNDERLLDPDDGQSWAVSPYVGLNLELVTPSLGLPGSPRIFVNAEMLPTYGVSLDLARDGNPTQIDRPAGIKEHNPPFLICPFEFGCYTETEINGTGSKTTAEIEWPSFAAHVGVSFPVELFGRQLHVKPSFGWMSERIKMDGKVLRSIKPVETLPDVRDVELTAGKTRSFHAIGPGLEIELDIDRKGPFWPSLYFEGHGYRMLTGRTTHFRKEKYIAGCTVETVFCGDVLPPATYEANWEVEQKRWIYRAGVGFRFRWIGY